MPITNLNKNEFPFWSEIEYYNIIKLNNNQKYYHRKKSEKEEIFIGRGDCDLFLDENVSKLKYGNHYTVDAESVDIISKSEQSIVIIVGGNWETKIGNCGVFKMTWSENPKNIGDPTNYDRNTDFDNHYHDCDEYWIIFNGTAVVMSEGNQYIISEGDCVITKMGDHHDIVNINDILEGVYFETTLKGKQRLGHLWEHTHK